MKNQFSLKRLLQYAKADMVTNRRQYILYLSLVAIVAMGLHYTTYFFQVHMSGATDVDYSYTYAFLSLFLLIIITYYISKSFHRFYDKHNASTNIMLPVSNAEKFTYISVWNILLYPAISILIAWLVSQGWAWWFDFENNFIVFKTVNNTFELAMIRSSIAATSSILVAFFIGSIIFRRMQYLLTILLFAILFTFVIIFYDDTSKTQFIMNNTWIIFSCEAIMIGFVYWRFKRLQITK